MSTLYVVRHGQASFMTDDYDRLSELGFVQGRALGRWWADRGVALDRVYVGPRRRHRETMEAAAEAYTAAGGAFPDPVELPELDEYQFGALLQSGLPQAIAEHPELGVLAGELMADTANRPRNFQRLFEAATRRWVRGELVFAEIEDWQAFRARVDAGLRRMIRDSDGPTDHPASGAAGPATDRPGAGRSTTVAAFTSGGPVAAATGRVLELADEKTLELSWMVQNGAFSEIRFARGGDRLSLSRFGAVAHLDAAAAAAGGESLLTYR